LRSIDEEVCIAKSTLVRFEKECEETPHFLCSWSNNKTGIIKGSDYKPELDNAIIRDPDSETIPINIRSASLQS